MSRNYFSEISGNSGGNGGGDREANSIPQGIVVDKNDKGPWGTGSLASTWHP